MDKSYHSTLRNILRGTQFSLRYIPVDAAVYIESSLTLGLFIFRTSFQVLDVIHLFFNIR